MFLVTTIWRGAMNVGNMRGFLNEEDAWAYWRSVESNASFKRIYKLSDSGEPELLKPPKE